MKETILMRVLFCRIQCPLMCFCKQSAAHPLKLESISSTFEGVKEEEEEEEEGVDAHTVIKSCIRKLCPRPDSTREVGKKKVQWMDHLGLGKELAEIREFESSESGDTDNEEEEEEESSRCLCLIL